MGVRPTTTEKSCHEQSQPVGQIWATFKVNFFQKLHISNHLPKGIFTKSCLEGPSFVGCTFLIHSLFFPAFPSSFSDLALLLSLFSWSISIVFSLLPSSRLPGNHVHGNGPPATFIPGRRNVYEGYWAADESYKKSLSSLFHYFLNVKSTSQIIRFYLTWKEKPVREAQHQ